MKGMGGMRLAKFKPGQGMGSIDHMVRGMPDAKPQSHEKTGAFITHSQYESETPTSQMSNNATDMSSHMGMMDEVAQHKKMGHDEIMNIRNHAHSKAEPYE